MAGRGIVYRSQLDMTPGLLAGRLQMVCPEWLGEPVPIYLMWADRRHLSPTGRLLREVFEARCLNMAESLSF